MKNIKYILIAAFVIILFSENTNAQQTNYFKSKGYVSLFNGNDLTGWQIPEGDNGHWSVLDGVIDYDAGSEAPGDKNLWSEKEYEDFELHVEWRFTGYGPLPYPVPTILPNGDVLRDNDGKAINQMLRNADSGIMLKGVGQTNLWCWPVGSGELWSVRNNKELPVEIRAGAVPIENADKPMGHWNAFDVVVKGDRITVVNNGIVVINNALYPGLDIKGKIGFQHHGGIDKDSGKLRRASSLVQFRNICIKEL